MHPIPQEAVDATAHITCELERRIRIARFVKIMSWRSLGVSKSLWMDSSFQLTMQPSKIETVIFPEGLDLVVHHHPTRNTVFNEAEECANIWVSQRTMIRKQFSEFTRVGFKDNIGLPATGLLFRRHNERIRRCMSRWWEQLCCGTTRDQVSFSFVMWLCPDVRWRYINENMFHGGRVQHCTFYATRNLSRRDRKTQLRFRETALTHSAE